MLFFAASLAIVACLVTSLAPAVRTSRSLIAGRVSDSPRMRMRSTFLAAQVAISVVLLTAAVLLGRGLEKAASQDVGFRLDTLMALRVDRDTKDGSRNAAVLRDVMAVIGDRRVAAASVMPLGDVALRTEVRRAGERYDANRRVRFHPAAGIVVGLPLAVLAGVGLRNYLYGLSPVDPMAYAAGVAAVVLVAWMATISPMRCALRVDPAVTLRHE